MKPTTDIELHMARSSLQEREGPAWGRCRRPKTLYPWRGRRPCRRAWAWLKAARYPTSQRPLAEKRGEPGQLDRPGSGGEVLPTGRAAGHLHAAAIPDFSKRRFHLHRLPVCRCGARHLHGRSWASADRFLEWAGPTAAGKATPWWWRSPASWIRPWFDRAGNHHSAQMKVIERYTPMGPNHLHYEATIEDPETFTRTLDPVHSPCTGAWSRTSG